MRAIAIADSDSYIKWGAALLSQLPTEWSTELVVVRTVKAPSSSQLATALSGSGIEPASVTFRDVADAVIHVASERPDVVLMATIGPLADILTEAVVASASPRPVIVSGLPGIGLPARRKALLYRSQADLVVLHSTREIRRFSAIALANGLTQQFALASLPFLGSAGATTGGTDVIFAAQAIVPPLREQRVRLLGWLAELAHADATRRVVIKVRAVGTEQQTHAETDGYADLLASEFPHAPANLVVEGGPMAAHLAAASALVTISSTAALEAIAVGVPVLAIDEFGVTPELINEVFTGSGLLGSAEQLITGDFRLAEPDWLADNYFHEKSANTWIDALGALVLANRVGMLPARSRVIRGPGGSLRRAWDRKRALGSHDRSLIGYLALAVGTPARGLVLVLRDLHRVTADPRPVRQPIPLDDEAPALRGNRTNP